MDCVTNPSSCASSAAEALNIKAEHEAISGALFGLASDDQVNSMQNELRSWGISASPSHTMLEAMLIPLVLLAIIGLMMRYIFFGFMTAHIMTSFAFVMIILGVVYFYTGKAYLKVLMKNTLFASYILMGFSIAWIVFFLGLYKKFPWVYDERIKKMNIARAVYVEATPLHYDFFTDMFPDSLEDPYEVAKQKAKKRRGKEQRESESDPSQYQGIGTVSMWIIGWGWIGFIFATTILITEHFHPELESFISRLKEGFMGKDESDEVDEVESFVDKSSTKEATSPADQLSLVNIQPVSIKQSGYVGPTERGGKFETDVAIINAVRAGVRFFTLQIDYLDSSPGPGFDKVNVPTLLYRDNSKVVISTNGASIADLAEKLSIYAFNKDFPTNTQPLILYLHFVRTPDYITKPDAYMKFLTDVAKALKPLQPNIMIGNEGTDFTRQQNERILLYTPLSAFENKVLVFTNADTTVFRNAERLSMTKVPLDQDLDYMTCMRVYLDDEADSLGVSTVASDGAAHAVIVSYKRIASMKAKKGDNKDKPKHDFAMKGKGRFVIAMPSQMDAPSQADIDALMKAAGVNTVPMNLFGSTDPDIKKQISAWADSPFYRLKPTLLQSTKVAVAGYTPPPNLLV